jgi:hypothetical protein
MKRLLYLFFAGLILISNSGYSQIDSLGYRLYSIVLDDYFQDIVDSNYVKKSVFSKKQLVVDTVKYKKVVFSSVSMDYKIRNKESFFNSYTDLNAETLEDFENSDYVNKQIDEQFKGLEFEIVLVHPDTISMIFKKDQENKWHYFYDNYPGSQGKVSLGNIGLDTNKNQALIYFSHGTWYRSGLGMIYFLIYKNGSWIIKSKKIVWRS